MSAKRGRMVVGAVVDVEVVDWVDRCAAKLGCTRSEFIAKMLRVTYDCDRPLIDFSLECGRAWRDLWAPAMKAAKPARA